MKTALPIQSIAAYSLEVGAPSLDIVIHDGEQAPPAQVRPARQLLPQAPQCSSEIVRSRHCPAHATSPPAHGSMQVFPEQILSKGQSNSEQQGKVEAPAHTPSQQACVG